MSGLVRIPRLLRVMAAAGSLLFATSASAEIVYDNTTASADRNFLSRLEFGDEIVLEGSSRVVTNFVFDLYASSLAGSEQARIRFYRNDGDPVPNVGAPRPGSVLYDSGFFLIPRKKGKFIPVPRLKVLVPDTFTWTIEFSGFGPDQAVGLKLYSPPLIGNNYPDLWEKSAEGWFLKTIVGSPVNDFGARMEATGSLDDNTAPYLTEIADQTLNQDTPGQVAFSMVDLETGPDQLIVRAESDNPVLFPPENLLVQGTGTNRTLLFTPGPAQSGTATVRVSLQDPSGLIDTSSFVVTVVPANRPPFISLLPDQTIAEDTPSSKIAFSVGDLETPPANLLVTAFTSNPDLIPRQNIIVEGAGPDRTVTVIPAPDRSGTATISLTVTDGGSLSSTGAFLVTVSPLNDPPTISAIAAKTTLEDTTTGPISFAIGDLETPQAALTLSGQSSNTALVPEGNIVFGGDGVNRTITVTPAANQFGTAIITVMVLDEAGGAASQFFDLTVISVNDLPQITPFPDQTTSLNTPITAIPFSISDLETPPERLNVSVRSENTLLIPNENLIVGGTGGERTLQIVPAPDLTGTAIIQIVVEDENGDRASQSFQVRVLAGEIRNLPRIASITPSQTLPLGGPVALAVEAASPGPLRYQWRLNGAVIPGATGPVYAITAFTLEQAGNYDVIVVNDFGLVESGSVVLLPAVDPIPLSDNVNAGPIFQETSRIGIADNISASRQVGEPLHAGKAGGHSVWMRWIAATDGIVTFRTTGSTFDTLLAVYRGQNLNELSPVVSDDDASANFTSAVAFNARAGETYQIAVDGFGGALGTIILSWDLEQTTDLVPVITLQPRNQGVLQGNNASFNVLAEGGPALTYQWFFGDISLLDETNSTLVLLTAQAAMVGNYSVVVRNGARSARSQPALLEITSEPGVFSVDKFQDLFDENEGGPSLQSRKRPGKSGFASVAAGSLGTQTMDNTRSTTEQGEPVHGGVVGGASRWFRLIPEADGLMVVDTHGSAIDTVLAVYRGKSLANLTLVQSNHRDPDGGGSLVKFNAGRGTNYLVAIDGANGAQGKIRLNWKLGVAPTIVQSPQSQEVFAGDSVTLSVSATGAPALTYQWQLNGTNLPPATGKPSLVLTNLQEAQAGSYRVVVSNFAGTARSAEAVITVRQLLPIQFGAIVGSGGDLQFQLNGPSGKSVRIETSTDLLDWVPLTTIVLTGGEGRVTENPSASYRFYRAVLVP